MILSHTSSHSLIQGIDLVGIILLVGGLVFRTVVVAPSPGQASFLERLLPFLLLLSGLSDLVLRSHMISGRPVEEIWSFLPAVLFKSHFGKVWMVRMFLLCLLSMASVIKTQGRIKEGLAITGGAFLLLTVSLSGHAADLGDFSLAMLMDWLHLVAVSAWMGGLCFLASVLKAWITSPTATIPAPLITSLKRFSTLAAACVILILVTGSYQTWLQVGSPALLLQTPYGQTLTAKLILALPLLALGALNRYRYLPKLSQQNLAQPVTSQKKGMRKLLRIVSLEIGLGLMIIACVALLTQLPPARSHWAATHQMSNQPMEHMGRGMAPAPALKPAEGASVKILSPKEGETFKGEQIPLQFKMVKGKRGSHVHAYVDGELMGMFQSEKGTLTGIQPGRHTLELRVVAEDHQTELEARDQVHFMVK